MRFSRVPIGKKEWDIRETFIKGLGMLQGCSKSTISTEQLQEIEERARIRERENGNGKRE